MLLAHATQQLLQRLLTDALIHGCLRHCHVKLLLVHAQLLGISDALKVVSQRVQDRIVDDVGGDETRWWREVGVWLLQQRVERLVHFETVDGVGDLHPSFLFT
jgi:hypothetical protein